MAVARYDDVVQEIERHVGADRCRVAEPGAETRVQLGREPSVRGENAIDGEGPTECVMLDQMGADPAGDAPHGLAVGRRRVEERGRTRVSQSPAGRRPQGDELDRPQHGDPVVTGEAVDAARDAFDEGCDADAIAR